MFATAKAIPAVLLASLLLGTSFAFASEVTGTLSSSQTEATATSGSQVTGTLGSAVDASLLGGTVVGSNSSNNSGGGRSNRTNLGAGGSVLGASDSVTDSPSFPNAGIFSDEDEEEEDYEMWATMMGVLALAASMLAIRSIYGRKQI